MTYGTRIFLRYCHRFGIWCWIYGKQKEDWFWLGFCDFPFECSNWINSGSLFEKAYSRGTCRKRKEQRMKVFGWICTIIGSLAFIGAAIYGHSVFGPVFWIALGIVLLLKSKKKI